MTEGHTLSHELLDELPPSRNQRSIRQLLVRTGVLEERNEDLERIPGWLEHELADKPTAHASLARPFLHWFLLRHARQRAAMRRHPASADRDLRRRVSVALDLLAWMDQRGLALADLAQEHLDDWTAGATSQRRYLIRYFLQWTTSRRLTRELTVPSIPSTPSCCLHGSPSSFGNLPNSPNCGRSSREPTQVLSGSSRAWSRASRSRRTA
ncbi:hypothetical protein ABT072_30780 [Streptomyces sp. NPDC002589]|uniref:hypothetical protein n=1 Tax=Streptomyces sp. NPDC002589 TaxID=3154420 RepID=UPI0033329E81